MKSLAIELVSKASAELFPDNTLISFTSILPQQLELEGQGEVAISEITYPSMHQKIKEGNFKSFDEKNLRSRQNFTTWNPIFTLPLQIMLKP